MKKRTLTPGNIILALIGFLFLTAFSVTLVLNLRPIYYYDIGHLNIAEETGYSKEVIRENYDALIDYNLITDRNKYLTLPDFPMSESGREHFWEVKEIFVAFQILMVVCGLIAIPSFIVKIRHHDYGCLELTAIFSFLIPVVLGILVAVNWEAVFTGFHKLVFRNDFWLFDPATDPVILILPDEFFAHCAVAILAVLLAGGILTGIAYIVLQHRNSTRTSGARANS